MRFLIFLALALCVYGQEDVVTTPSSSPKNATKFEYKPKHPFDDSMKENPLKEDFDTDTRQYAKVRVAVPLKESFNNPDIRMLARLAVAMVQSKMYKGTPYETKPIFKDRQVGHVDVEHPSISDLATVMDKKQAYVDTKNDKVDQVDAQASAPWKAPKEER